MTEQIQITKDTVIEDVFQLFPAKAQKLSQTMSNAGINCVGCSASTQESIEQGMLSHGIEAAEVTKLVNELNKIAVEIVDPNANVGVTISELAAEKCKEYQKDPSHMFKIVLNKGSCGFTYGFKFKDTKDENELEFEDKGIKILIDKADIDKINGMTVDYVEGMQGAGFKISNPNVKGSCGCGSASQF